jgi:hypothetical protein
MVAAFNKRQTCRHIIGDIGEMAVSAGASRLAWSRYLRWRGTGQFLPLRESRIILMLLNILPILRRYQTWVVMGGTLLGNFLRASTERCLFGCIASTPHAPVRLRTGRVRSCRRSVPSSPITISSRTVAAARIT